MSENWFSDNYGDMSVQGGLNAGFQFEFFCERCRDAYRTQFAPYRKAQAAGLLGEARGLLGGIFGQADDAANTFAQAGWRTAWDEAFQHAVADAQSHFHRCAKCFQYMCDKCYNASNGLCFSCAPDAEVELEVGKAQGMGQGAYDHGSNVGYAAGTAMDAKRDRQLVCPSCGAEAHGAKFCPECGTALAAVAKCAGCNTESPLGTKFCPECGQKL